MIEWSEFSLKKKWKKWELTIYGSLLFVLAFKLSHFLYWLMANLVATSPPKGDSAKGSVITLFVSLVCKGVTFSYTTS